MFKTFKLWLILFSLSLTLTMGGVSVANAFTNHDVTVGGVGNVFTPPELTINVGDTVTWTNAGGFHNVVSDAVDENGDPIFSSGPASIDAWTYQFTFNTPGSYSYVCQPHATIGMTGTITVVETPTAVTIDQLGALNGSLPVTWQTLLVGFLAIGSLIVARFLTNVREA